MTTTAVLSARIARSARAAIIPVAGGSEGDSDAWHSIRNAVVRAMRRELGLPRHGLAPVAVLKSACKYADIAYFMRGWESSFAAADAAIKPALRRFVRRARKGTLA